MSIRFLESNLIHVEQEISIASSRKEKKHITQRCRDLKHKNKITCLMAFSLFRAIQKLTTQLFKRKRKKQLHLLFFHAGVPYPKLATSPERDSRGRIFTSFHSYNSYDAMPYLSLSLFYSEILGRCQFYIKTARP